MCLWLLEGSKEGDRIEFLLLLYVGQFHSGLLLFQNPRYGEHSILIFLIPHLRGGLGLDCELFLRPNTARFALASTYLDGRARNPHQQKLLISGGQRLCLAYLEGLSGCTSIRALLRHKEHVSEVIQGQCPCALPASSPCYALREDTCQAQLIFHRLCRLFSGLFIFLFYRVRSTDLV